MREIKWTLDTGFAGANHEGVIEVEDNATEEEIDEEVKEVALEHVEWYWTEE
jgi:hypothetical protein